MLFQDQHFQRNVKEGLVLKTSAFNLLSTQLINPKFCAKTVDLTCSLQINFCVELDRRMRGNLQVKLISTIQ